MREACLVSCDRLHLPASCLLLGAWGHTLLSTLCSSTTLVPVRRMKALVFFFQTSISQKAGSRLSQAPCGMHAR